MRLINPPTLNFNGKDVLILGTSGGGSSSTEKLYVAIYGSTPYSLVKNAYDSGFTVVVKLLDGVGGGYAVLESANNSSFVFTQIWIDDNSPQTLIGKKYTISSENLWSTEQLNVVVSWNNISGKPDIPPELHGGTNINIDGGNNINCTYAYVLPTATTDQLGGVKIGNTLSISNGVINYDLPVATNDILGGVKKKDNGAVEIDTNGVLDLSDEWYSLSGDFYNSVSGIGTSAQAVKNYVDSHMGTVVVWEDH